MIQVDPVVARIWEMAGSGVFDEGVEIVDIEVRSEGSRSGRVLRIFLDKAGGPTLDDITRVSRRLNELFDEALDVGGSYVLEVSSPGINRALHRQAGARPGARPDRRTEIVFRHTQGGHAGRNRGRAGRARLSHRLSADRKGELRARLERVICSRI